MIGRDDGGDELGRDSDWAKGLWCGCWGEVVACIWYGHENDLGEDVDVMVMMVDFSDWFPFAPVKGLMVLTKIKEKKLKCFSFPLVTGWSIFFSILRWDSHLLLKATFFHVW